MGFALVYPESGAPAVAPVTTLDIYVPQGVSVNLGADRVIVGGEASERTAPSFGAHEKGVRRTRVPSGSYFVRVETVRSAAVESAVESVRLTAAARARRRSECVNDFETPWARI